MGRGLGEQHRGRTKSLVPRIGIDYLYFTDRGIRGRNELEEYPENPSGEIAFQEDRQTGKVVK